ncbi:2TM domain-containing protein [Hymenobacter sp. BT507]|uniref:2TM domain-containing protein n=1 Tax=Hymenobacter citatus TaxID=2763506 RepID=A0ABR7MFB8_9BACT|nr:2TM domain-containing protein [Hymenobacter citatus]MBC6609781.1 2TM domain-containing protein [Hymenobacter citatus]
MEPINRDPQLWRQAKARARFKASLFTYFWVNALLWTIWVLTGRGAYPVPWPLWATFFWGIALLANGASVYGWWGQGQQAEREYERLLREKR